MRRVFAHCLRGLPVLAAALVPTVCGAGERLPLPSGLTVTLQDIIWDREAQTGRFRFIAPELPDAMANAAPLDTDMMALCTGFAQPLTKALQPGWTQAVISLSAMPTVFGEYDPTIPQIFEGFIVMADGCDWEAL